MGEDRKIPAIAHPDAVSVLAAAAGIGLIERRQGLLRADIAGQVGEGAGLRRVGQSARLIAEQKIEEAADAVRGAASAAISMAATTTGLACR